MNDIGGISVSVSPVALRSFLESAGWQYAAPVRQHAEIWERNGNQILVPLMASAADYPRRVRNFVEDVARIRNDSAEQILRELTYAEDDVIEISFTNTTDILSLDAADFVIGKLKDLTRASACSAITRRAYHGDFMPIRARRSIGIMGIGHIRPDRFVIPLISPTSGLRPMVARDRVDRRALDIHLGRDYLYFPRRVMGMVASNLESLRNLVLSPSRLPGSEDLRRAVLWYGLSANACDALAEMISAQGVGSLDVTLRWAVTAAPLRTDYSDMEFPADSSDAIRRVGTLLRQQSAIEDTVLYGYVISLRSNRLDPARTVKLRALVEGQVRQVKATLNQEAYTNACEAYDLRMPLVITGRLRNSDTSSLAMVEVSSVRTDDYTPMVATDEWAADVLPIGTKAGQELGKDTPDSEPNIIIQVADKDLPDAHDYLARESKARVQIDKQLAATGWVVQSQADLNLNAGPGVAVREFTLGKPHGRVDYLLFLDGRPAGVIEAKPEGTTLVEVEHQSGSYVEGLPGWMRPPVYPLPFIYESTGAETRFTNGYDPDARSRRVFTFHRPETLIEWSRQIIEDEDLPTFRARLRTLPPLDERGLWGKQAEAIRNLEESLAADRPRALIQMATGSGKTFTAANISYRLIKWADAKRVLFLVDRANLGQQAKLEFDKFTILETQRKFPTEYNVQHLTTNTLDTTSRVCIATVQRIFSMLKGEPDLDREIDEHSSYELHLAEPAEVAYNPVVPPDAFDVIIIDECHRSIYGLWRQVLEYFDAYLIGLTATPTKQAFGFFRQNLVMEYSHEMAVSDGVNVDFSVYKINTAISRSGSTVEAGEFVGFRDRQTRQIRWDATDEPISYTAAQLDRAVVAQDQIRTVIQTFRDKLFIDLFPGRSTVPKTLIFAKDDSHADDVVQIVREVFGKGNEFATKITYRPRDGKAEDLLQAFRNSLNPRIVVTVDMIATGTDVKPLECLIFMRSVKSRTYFEQMLGRGVRVIDDTDFQSVTDDAKSKDLFVVVDAVGVTDTPLAETVQPLERYPSVGLLDLFKQVSFGDRDPKVASSIAGRLARLDKHLTDDDRDALAVLAGGQDLGSIVRGIVDALDPDQQLAATVKAGLSGRDPQAVAATATAMLDRVLQPLTTNPGLRAAILEVRKSYHQTIDEVSKDQVLFAGHSAEARATAEAMISSFRQYIDENKDEIRALHVLYNRPRNERLTFAEVKDLARAIERPPRQWTPEKLWRAYEVLDESSVRRSGGKMLTDIVSLVRYALHQEGELVPYKDKVEERFAAWLTTQENNGVTFTNEQRQWLTWMKDNIASEFGITSDSFEYTPFVEHGSIGRAVQVFGDRLTLLIDDLTEALVA